MDEVTHVAFLAEIAIPNAWQCLVIAAPILSTSIVLWMITRTNPVIDEVFPQWEWEKRLGWLNIQADRKADAVVRWIGYFIYALLAFALYGIVWGASAFENINKTLDPSAVAEGMGRLSTLLVCIAGWVLYLGWELIPKLRRQYESEELEKYRLEQAELEAEAERAKNPTSRYPTADLNAWRKSPSLGRRN